MRTAFGAENFWTSVAVVPLFESAVNAWVNEPRCRALVVHEVLAGRSSHVVRLVPGAQKGRVFALGDSRDGFASAEGRVRGACKPGATLLIGTTTVAALVEGKEYRAERQGADCRSNHDSDLLIAGRRAQQETGFQVLGSRASIGRGDATMPPTESAVDVIRSARPAPSTKNEAVNRSVAHRHSEMD